VYIREAHPSDEWQMEVNVKDDVVLPQPKTETERKAVASSCASRLKLSMPVLVDNMRNEVDELYAAWPERLFVIDGDGKIAYAGDRGPWGFKPDEVADWLKKNIGPAQTEPRR
jgi:hypothetical protein